MKKYLKCRSAFTIALLFGAFFLGMPNAHAARIAPYGRAGLAKTVQSAAGKLGNAGMGAQVQYLEDMEHGTITTIGEDGTEYVVDMRHHIALVRKSGIVLDSICLTGGNSLAGNQVADPSSATLVQAPSDN